MQEYRIKMIYDYYYYIHTYKYFNLIYFITYF